MKELSSVLQLHARCYPGMQPRDAVKLIYQNEFGGGHLIRDEAACLAYLQQEYAAVCRDPVREAFEPIGNGILRVQLAALTPRQLPCLAAVFIRSAAEHTGSKDRFLEKLQCLQALTARGIFDFDLEALQAYLDGYAAQGYPAVSHSDRFRRLYHPAYRIILEKYRNAL